MTTETPKVTPKISLSAGIGGHEESDSSLRELLSDAMSACGKDRDQIASELSQKVGRTEKPLTASILNDYTARTKTAARFPAAYVRAFCEVTGSDALQMSLMSQRQKDLIKIGERELASQRNRSAKDSIMRRLLIDEDQERG